MYFPKPWQQELWELSRDGYGNGVMYCDDDFIIVKDKFPKSTMHYLVVTRNGNLTALDALTPGDEDVLLSMRDVGLKWLRENIEGIESIPLTVGFHSIPSMRQIHLHLISSDMITPTLPHLRHYNTCTTSYMRSVGEVVSELSKTGKIIIPGYSRSMANKLHASAVCNRIGCEMLFTGGDALLDHLHKCELPLPGVMLEAFTNIKLPSGKIKKKSRIQ